MNELTGTSTPGEEGSNHSSSRHRGLEGMRRVSQDSPVVEDLFE